MSLGLNMRLRSDMSLGFNIRLRLEMYLELDMPLGLNMLLRSNLYVFVAEHEAEVGHVLLVGHGVGLI